MQELLTVITSNNRSDTGSTSICQCGHSMIKRSSHSSFSV